MTSRIESIDDSDVLRMYEVEGMTQQEIAEYYEVSRSCIYGRLHIDKKKAYRNSDKGKAVRKKYFQSEEGKAAMKRANQSEAGVERRERHAKTEKRKESNRKHRKIYNQSEKGIIYKGIRRAKRRELGFEPLNKWFDEGEWHHVNLNVVICIPAEIHKSFHHNVFTGEGMEAINKEAFEFLEWEMREKQWEDLEDGRGEY